jgi:hypothetical protein
MRKTKLFRVSVPLFAAVALIGLGGPVALAHPGPPDHVWIGPLPEACLTIWDPVHDAQGNTYSNVCFAAADGVRVTWNGESH